MKIVSYYTPDGQYPAYAERLKKSAARFDLPCQIMQMPRGPSVDWKAACNQKPTFLLQMLIAHRGPILWVDVDCEIMRLPSIFWQHPFDFGIYSWSADSANREEIRYQPEEPIMASGVVYLDYTAPVMELLVKWIDAIPTAKVVDDQVLDLVWKAARPPVEVFWLPRTANWMVGPFGEPTKDVIIRHDYHTGKNMYNVGLNKVETAVANG